MAVRLYLDVHVPRAIADQLERRNVDVITTIEDGRAVASDEEVLTRAHELTRVVFTQDIRFKALAESWQRSGRPFSGLIFGHQLGATLGRYVVELELVAKASEPEEWKSVVAHLPF
jgi:predicted nuclease of predicted toxin-antitoxin system